MLLTPALLLASAASPLPLEPAVSDGITWHSGTFFAALGEAGERDTHVLLYFWYDGSEQCSNMYGVTMAEESVIPLMNERVCFSANTADPKGYKLVERFGVKSLPTVLFVKPDGTVDDAVVGFADPGLFHAELGRIAEGRDTITDFRKRAAEAPEDLDVQYALSVKLADCGDEAGAKEITGAIKAADPKGKTVIASRLFMQDIQESLVEAAKQEEGEYDFKGVDLAPLEDYLGKVKHTEILFDGWSWMAAVEREAENAPAARLASMNAWPNAPEEAAHEVGREIAVAFFEDREDLDRKEKKFALEVAEASAKLAAKYRQKVAAEHEGDGSHGCASWNGCPEGEDDGCGGGCEGQKGELVKWEAQYLDTLACCLWLNGKKREAKSTLARSKEMFPDCEAIAEHEELIGS